MTDISLDHYIGREVVKSLKGSVVLDGDVQIFNDDKNRDIEEIPKGSRLVTVVMDSEETRAVFQDSDGNMHNLTLTATEHSLSDPERTEGERVPLQGGGDSRDLSVPPEPSERDSESEEHLAEAAKAREQLAEDMKASLEDEDEE